MSLAASTSVASVSGRQYQLPVSLAASTSVASVGTSVASASASVAGSGARILGGGNMISSVQLDSVSFPLLASLPGPHLLNITEPECLQVQVGSLVYLLVIEP